MAKKEKQNRFTQRASWLLWGLLAGLLMVLASAFAKTWQTGQALKAELATLEPMVTAAMAEQATLEAELDYVQSDAYVEEWSLTEARMTRSGETLVIPVIASPTPTPTATPTPEPSAAPTVAPTAAPFWARWWQALVGE
jgi:cell division protein FtsB